MPVTQQQQGAVPAAKTVVTISDASVVKLVLEYLEAHSLNVSMLSVERETGVTNGVFSDDLAFLRQLVLDGSWDDALDFAQPLLALSSFP